ncbi:uncharacterized protein EDB93DRAFT_203748 [Suillus bovinus]|uniref:uncharacterized protein n=1 Tax=Suillus bovinus TaxID=48563 RepID=UPI001B8638CF|nr:uncharacterized protein EDB93DRAFT_203748 [Suillus bovinus]KAG2127549.1 hypothetical protein EDB93DRAFT_203748 [Suillus bovinus]
MTFFVSALQNLTFLSPLSLATALQFGDSVVRRHSRRFVYKSRVTTDLEICTLVRRTKILQLQYSSACLVLKSWMISGRCNGEYCVGNQGQTSTAGGYGSLYPGPTTTYARTTDYEPGPCHCRPALPERPAPAFELKSKKFGIHSFKRLSNLRYGMLCIMDCADGHNNHSTSVSHFVFTSHFSSHFIFEIK